jgi:hypothetical protein
MVTILVTGFLLGAMKGVTEEGITANAITLKTGRCNNREYNNQKM